MSRLACVTLVSVVAAMGLTAGSGARAPLYACDPRQLAFALREPSAPMQTWAVGLAVHNTGVACRLALPVSLKLVHRSGRPLRVAPRTSWLTLVARSFGARAKASVGWTYANYCGGHRTGARPIVYIVRVPGTELRGRGGVPPCHAPEYPVRLRVLFACPRATGPAIRAILPRALPLCVRE